jgi:hypothetical protein
MSDQQTPSKRALQALELADGYLDEAQDVLWNTASELPDNTESHQIEELTEEIWTIQHQLIDLQQEVEQ